MWLTITGDKLIRYVNYIVFIMGLLIGLFGTYYVVNHLYQFTGPVCIFGIHFHHLYLGAIIGIIFMILWLRNRKKKENVNLIFLFLFGFGMGMMIDDILDHFVFQLDPFYWLC